MQYFIGSQPCSFLHYPLFTHNEKRTACLTVLCVHLCFSLLLAVPLFQDLFNDYSCSCQPGYFGRNCEMEIDECLPRPCENGGTCTDLVNGYRCNCPTDFEVYGTCTTLNNLTIITTAYICFRVSTVMLT